MTHTNDFCVHMDNLESDLNESLSIYFVKPD